MGYDRYKNFAYEQLYLGEDVQSVGFLCYKFMLFIKEKGPSASPVFPASQ
jgi:hypothetical protein